MPVTMARYNWLGQTCSRASCQTWKWKEGAPDRRKEARPEGKLEFEIGLDLLADLADHRKQEHHEDHDDHNLHEGGHKVVQHHGDVGHGARGRCGSHRRVDRKRYGERRC